jgi:hypothetical protein
MFQRMMNMQFVDIIATGRVIIYMDDILVATRNDLEEHRQLVHQILARLKKMDLYLKPAKCIFETRKIEFLGVILEDRTVTMDLVKVAGVEEWKEPKTVKEIRKFLGFCNFYRHFIRGFSHITKPLNSLLKKDIKWNFGNTKKAAFEKLKKLICEEPILIQPDQNKPFEVEVDTSNYAVRAVLMQ